MNQRIQIKIKKKKGLKLLLMSIKTLNDSFKQL